MWSSVLSVLFSAIVTVGWPSTPWLMPLTPDRPVERPFERPHDRFAPGHRGSDWAATPGEPVFAVSAGTVTHVGQVAGIASVTLDHGVVRSSYLPVISDLAVGSTVQAGEQIGWVEESSHCTRTCLHVGIRTSVFDTRDATVDPYLDPLAWIERVPVLKPLQP